MSARRKQPAYGKALLDRRRAGDHPLIVHLVYGDLKSWFEMKDEPRVCVKADEYEPGKLDFRVLAGLKVVVHDMVAAFHDADPDAEVPVFDKFFDMLGEIAAVAAIVAVDYHTSEGREIRPLRGVAWGMRIVGVVNGRKRRVWPRWWSEDLDATAEDREYGWLQDDAVARGVVSREFFREQKEPGRGRAA